MTDTTTVWNVALARGDWQLSGPVLLTGNDLETAVLISLFSDRLANPDDSITDGTNDPRGWWGDSGQDVPIGSRLWLLERAVLTSETALKAKDYAVEALQWLIDDGIAVQIDVTTEITLPAMLGIGIVIWRQNGSRVAMKFDWAWKGLH